MLVAARAMADRKTLRQRSQRMQVDRKSASEVFKCRFAPAANDRFPSGFLFSDVAMRTKRT